MNSASAHDKPVGFPSSCWAGIHPTIFECSFWSESMNGMSAGVAMRIATAARGRGNLSLSL